MPKFRLVNCDFLNDSSFLNDRTNKAKLLYVFMFLNADDLGFVGNTANLVQTLTNSEKGEVSLELLNNDYKYALDELLTHGYLYEFRNKYGNTTYLIRHWFWHNKFKKGLKTNYWKYRSLVDLVDYEYIFRKESIKEKDKLNQDNINQNKPNQAEDYSYRWDEILEGLEDK